MLRRIIYYHTERGESPVQDFIDGLSVKEQAKCLAYITALRDSPLPLPSSIAKKVEGKLWELRPEFGGTEFRLFYFFSASAIVFVHALKKKSQQLKRADIELAARRMQQHEETHPTHEN